MYYVYILYSEKDRGLYIGYTTNLKHRLLEHQNGLSKSTKHRAPVRLVHYEAFQESADARAREKYLKSGHGREQLKAQLKRLFAKLKFT
ncbi:excinuclease ABC subunit C [Candidatus Kaiserbacteria bacterium RIFCSPLOWO2_01_FULL_54_13]|uniref:Excinuclease ABC subunit C n=1 Tax=Candidatus Kaiserbacteria bacterium RIFCSPLOWO2_01_FULL_54_13 TaxID=1798512 RepID=A0A1F6F468_9BACT|nr:MAG: excinuclease ABC subunit C [Candidatus Kaiserbacteria bacterium RIFCSPLOWO2_01_FULL_54_13]